MNHTDIRLEDGFTIAEKIATFTEHELHTHDALEISIVISNQINYHLLDRDYVGKPGDVFLYRPFEPHWTLAQDKNKPARWIMGLFTPAIVNALPLGAQLLTPFYSARMSPHIPGSSPHAPQIRDAALQAVTEQKERRPGWETKLLLHMLDMILLIYRHYMEDSEYSPEEERSDMSGMIQVIQHLTQHLHEKIPMADMIRLSQMRKTRFYHKFKAITGLSPNQFIQRLRLQQAIHKLNYTSLPVTQIAYDCGFETVSYFNRSFKQYVKLSPSEYRKLYVR